MKSQGAPRTCRCIETCGLPVSVWLHEVREHHAPVGALRHRPAHVEGETTNVREHHAPVGALRRIRYGWRSLEGSCQGAPRTCRCIETSVQPTR